MIDALGYPFSLVTNFHIYYHIEKYSFLLNDRGNQDIRKIIFCLIPSYYGKVVLYNKQVDVAFY